VWAQGNLQSREYGIYAPAVCPFVRSAADSRTRPGRASGPSEGGGAQLGLTTVAGSGGLHPVTHSQTWSADVIQRVSTLVPLMVVTLLGNGARRCVARQRGHHRGADMRPAPQRHQPREHFHHQPRDW